VSFMRSIISPYFVGPRGGRKANGWGAGKGGAALRTSRNCWRGGFLQPSRKKKITSRGSGEVLRQKRKNIPDLIQRGNLSIGRSEEEAVKEWAKGEINKKHPG